MAWLFIAGLAGLALLLFVIELGGSAGPGHRGPVVQRTASGDTPPA
jgi:hypothetical protein